MPTTKQPMQWAKMSTQGKADQENANEFEEVIFFVSELAFQTMTQGWLQCESSARMRVYQNDDANNMPKHGKHSPIKFRACSHIPIIEHLLRKFPLWFWDILSPPQNRWRQKAPLYHGNLTGEVVQRQRFYATWCQVNKKRGTMTWRPCARA